MSARVKRVAKVIIGGQWYTVRVGSLQIVDMEFTDDDGNPVHAEPLDTPGYTFVTENGDEYYGPLSSIDLFKLVDV
jgi:uncharacterized protein (UPF0305 family)